MQCSVGINWSTITYSDLNVPLYSGLAARLWISLQWEHIVCITHFWAEIDTIIQFETFLHHNNIQLEQKSRWYFTPHSWSNKFMS